MHRLVLVLGITAGLTANPGIGRAQPEVAKGRHAKLESVLGSVVDAADRGVPAADAVQMLVNDLAQEDSIPVSIWTTAPVDLQRWLVAQRARVANARDDIVEAIVTVDVLRNLGRRSDVVFVRQVRRPEPLVTSQGVNVHDAANWQTHGMTGNGVRVGVIDGGFQGFGALMGTEVPGAVTARCYSSVGVYSSDLAWCQRNTSHGTGVVETVMDVAPSVQLYIANPVSRLDLLQTVEWMASQGVRVVNYSMGWTWDGPGDGTSPYADSPLRSVDTAVARGMLFAVSAGNSGQKSWLGPYTDGNGDGWADFTPSGTRLNSVYASAGQPIVLQLRWQDSWGSAAKDLDLYLFDSSYAVVAYSIDIQTGQSGNVPFEFLYYVAPVTGTYWVGVDHYAGAAPGWLQLQQFLGAGPRLTSYTSGGSMLSPAETANAGALAVGAAHWSTPGTLESFSSRGPTPDGRVKPDVVGADGGDTVTYGPGGFYGTSQASPHVAGLAALVRQAFPSYTPRQVADYLKYFAQPRGAIPNTSWGYGFAFLPALGCANSLSPTSASIGAPGGTGTVAVTAAPACYWTAQSHSAFLTATGGGSQYGSGTLSYHVAANPGGLRTGTMTIADRTFTVTQAPFVPPTPPTLAPVPGGVITIGGTNTLTGSGFTAGTRVVLYVASSSAVATHGPYVPTSWSPASLVWTPPATVPLGNGFGSVQVVNTDQGHLVSNVVAALLEGDPADNIPTIRSLNGQGLESVAVGIPLAHVDTVVLRNGTVTIGGTGFNNAGVNLYAATGNIGPLWPLVGATSTRLQVVVPSGAPTGPASFQVVNSPYSGNVASNAVSAVIGARPTIASVTTRGGTVTVTGTGFCPLSVINLFNMQGTSVVNLGGLASGAPRIPLTVASDTQFTFTVPAGAVSGSAFIQVINPPYIPYSSSGNDPDGAFTIP